MHTQKPAFTKNHSRRPQLISSLLLSQAVSTPLRILVEAVIEGKRIKDR